MASNTDMSNAGPTKDVAAAMDSAASQMTSAYLLTGTCDNTLTKWSCLVSNGCQDGCTNGTTAGFPTPTPTTTPAPSPTPSPAAKSQLSKTEIIAITVSSFVASCLLIVFVFVYRRMQNKHAITMKREETNGRLEENRGIVLRIMERPGGLDSLSQTDIGRQLGIGSSPRLLGGGGRFGGAGRGRVLGPAE